MAMIYEVNYVLEFEPAFKSVMDDMKAIKISTGVLNSKILRNISWKKLKPVVGFIV